MFFSGVSLVGQDLGEKGARNLNFVGCATVEVVVFWHVMAINVCQLSPGVTRCCQAVARCSLVVARCCQVSV